MPSWCATDANRPHRTAPQPTPRYRTFPNPSGSYRTVTFVPVPVTWLQGIVDALDNQRPRPDPFGPPVRRRRAALAARPRSRSRHRRAADRGAGLPRPGGAARGRRPGLLRGRRRDQGPRLRRHAGRPARARDPEHRARHLADRGQRRRRAPDVPPRPRGRPPRSGRPDPRHRAARLARLHDRGHERLPRLHVRERRRARADRGAVDHPAARLDAVPVRRVVPPGGVPRPDRIVGAGADQGTATPGRWGTRHAAAARCQGPVERARRRALGRRRPLRPAAAGLGRGSEPLEPAHGRDAPGRDRCRDRQGGHDRRAAEHPERAAPARDRRGTRSRAAASSRCSTRCTSRRRSSTRTAGRAPARSRASGPSGRPCPSSPPARSTPSSSWTCGA